MPTRFTDIHLVLPSEVARRDLLVADNGRILAHLPPEAPAPEGTTRRSGGGAYAFPGMVDVLTHGYGPQLYKDCTPGGVAECSRLLPRHGVTAFAPSLTSERPAVLLEQLRVLASQCDSPGARCLGIHSEGPFLGSPGAHRPEALSNPSPELAAAMLAAGNGKLAFVTLAGELPGAAEFCAEMRRAGVGLHLGHTNASPAQVPAMAPMGFSAVTHIYDVFRPAEVTEPGVYPLSLADAILADERLALGLICDGVHVHPTQVKLLSLLGPERVFLETDSMKFTGLPPSRFELYPGTWVRTTPDRAARMDNDGLAGSCLTSDQALRNFLAFTGVSLPRASVAASLLPAQLAGRAADLGSLEVGKQADLFFLEPRTLSVLATFVAGRQVYAREA